MTAHGVVGDCPVVTLNVRWRQLTEGTKMRNCQCSIVIEQNGDCSQMKCPLSIRILQHLQYGGENMRMASISDGMRSVKGLRASLHYGVNIFSCSDATNLSRKEERNELF